MEQDEKNLEGEEENVVEENLEEFNREIDFEKAEENKQVKKKPSYFLLKII